MHIAVHSSHLTFTMARVLWMLLQKSSCMNAAAAISMLNAWCECGKSSGITFLMSYNTVFVVRGTLDRVSGSRFRIVTEYIFQWIGYGCGWSESFPCHALAIFGNATYHRNCNKTKNLRMKENVRGKPRKLKLEQMHINVCISCHFAQVSPSLKWCNFALYMRQCSFFVDRLDFARLASTPSSCLKHIFEALVRR